jgi:hypothetical protein
MKFAERQNDRSMKIRMATRAIQSGGDLESIWPFIDNVGQESTKYQQEVEQKWSEMSRRNQSAFRTKSEREAEAWIILGEALVSIGEGAKLKELEKFKDKIEF